MRIFNTFINNLRSEKAFTLVEAVVAISIIGVIGVIMSDILTRAFDNTQKTNLISNVQQNGQAALSSFEDTIRYSEFVCVGGITTEGLTTPNTIAEYNNPVLVVYKEGKYIRIRIVPQSGSINGYITEDFPLPPVVDATATDLCSTVSLSDMRKITNDTMLSVKNGSISLLSNPINSATVGGTSKVSLTIRFAIGSGFGAPVNPESQIGTNNEIVFQSTVQFR